MTAALFKKLVSVKDHQRLLRSLSSDQKNAVLLAAARLLGERQALVLAENRKDVKALGKNATPAFLDRLTLNEERVGQMIESLKAVAALVDPVGEVAEERTLPNGLKIRRVRSPLGVIFMIFESRPNVAMEAFSLAFKAGNGVILRGGKESMRTTKALYSILNDALAENQIPPGTFWGITNPDRKISLFLLKQRSCIDVVVPRGGDGLINFVMKNSEIPVIKNDRGLCHVYVHEDADLEMATRIAVNAKTQRPGVCNAMETLLVHEKVAALVLPQIHKATSQAALQWFADPKAMKILKGLKNVKPAKKDNWDTEYLDLKMNCRVVSSLDEAIDHIERHGSRHSESIVTSSRDAARKFQGEVDAAAVYWNASTRFTDGFQMGLGGELGISTQKLHVRGPVGLRELTSLRWVVDGEGQIRS